MTGDYSFQQRVYRIRSFMAKGLPYFIKYGRWRLKYRLYNVKPPRAAAGNSALFKDLNTAIPELKEIQNQFMRGDSQTAVQNLIAFYRQRATPHFFFNEQAFAQITAQIAAPEKTSTIRAAEEICQGFYRFRGADPVDFSSGVDWLHRPMGNIDWSLDLNRHTLFVTLGRAFHYSGDEKYARHFCALAQDWLRQNPLETNQPNWSRILQAAMRLNNWIWAFFLFQNAKTLSSEFLVTFLNGIIAHGHYLHDLIEFHAENNHLLIEAKVLAMVGLLFPEFKAAKDWRSRGQRLLYQEITKQVCPDGVHGERAALYQRLVGGEILEYLVLMENNARQVPAHIIDLFNHIVEFEIWSTKPDGQMPLWGDSSLADTGIRYDAASCGALLLKRTDLYPHVSPANEAGVWLLGIERVRNRQSNSGEKIPLRSREFADGGYFILRDGRESASQFLMFDCGPFGYPPLPSHGHADALSFELVANGQTLLVDPGVYSTRLGDNWRNHFRGSSAHNTVVVDEKDQSILVDIWRVRDPALPALHHWFSDDYLDFIDGSHNGYERFANPIIHRRQILYVKPEYWLVVDDLEGEGVHNFDFFYHVHPAFTVQDINGKSIIRAANDRQPQLLLLTQSDQLFESQIAFGAENPIQGWFSNYSGEKSPAPVICFRLKAPAPVRFTTAMLPVKSEGDLQVSISPLPINGNNLATRHLDIIAGYQITRGKNIDYLVINKGATQKRVEFAGITTDAEVFFARFNTDEARFTKIHLRNGQELSIAGHPIPNLTGHTGGNLDII